MRAGGGDGIGGTKWASQRLAVLTGSRLQAELFAVRGNGGGEGEGSAAGAVESLGSAAGAHEGHPRAVLETDLEFGTAEGGEQDVPEGAVQPGFHFHQQIAAERAAGCLTCHRIR